MKHLKTLLGLLVLLGALSCTKTRLSLEGSAITFAVSPSYDLIEVTKGNLSDYTVLPQASDFDLVITDDSGAGFWSGKLSDWDPATKIPAGDYIATATYGDLDIEGFDKPYFEGKAEFSVKGAETSDVSIPVSLANTIIKIECNDMFKNYYTEYEFKLFRGSTDIAVFDKGEVRGAFVDGYKVSISGLFKTATGVEKTFEHEYTNLDAATAYTMQFELANAGGSSVTIRFNNDVETVTLEDVELND